MRIVVLNIAPEQTQSTWDGQTRDRVKQWCEIEQNGLRTSFQITTEPGKEYAPGEYELAHESFSVTNGRLTVNRVVLKPVPKSAPAPSKAA